MNRKTTKRALNWKIIKCTLRRTTLSPKIIFINQLNLKKIMKNFFITGFTILLLIFTACENDIVQDFDDLVTQESNELQTKNGLDRNDNTTSNATSPLVETTSLENEESTTELDDTRSEDEDSSPELEDTSTEDEIKILEIDPTIETERDIDNSIDVNSIYLSCLPNSNFIIRATYNDQTNALSFEYFSNSANTSAAKPIDIEWTISDSNDTRAAIQPQSGATAENPDFDFGNNYNVDVSIAFDDNTSFEDVFCLNIDEANPSAFNVCSEHQTADSCTDRNVKGGNKRTLVIVDVVL